MMKLVAMIIYYILQHIFPTHHQLFQDINHLKIGFSLFWQLLEL